MNGSGKGTNLGVESVIIDKKLVELTNNDYFLDSVTGDLYSYNYETNEWIPRANVGLHCRKDAEGFNSLGKYVVSGKKYRPKTGS